MFFCLLTLNENWNWSLLETLTQSSSSILQMFGFWI